MLVLGSAMFDIGDTFLATSFVCEEFGSFESKPYTIEGISDRSANNFYFMLLC